MLAGGAIVLFYGMASAGIAWIISLFVAYRIPHHTLIKFNIILGILFVTLACFVAYQFINREKSSSPVEESPKTKTVIAPRLYFELP